MAKAWLNDIGLSQYSQAFQNHLVDGRMLHSLMKRDLEKHLNVSKKFHQVSILLGIELLYQVNFSREVRTRAGDGGILHSPSFPTGTHCLSIQLSAHPCIHPHTHPSTWPSMHRAIHASVRTRIHPSLLPTPAYWAWLRPCVQFRGSGEPSSSESSLLVREYHKELVLPYHGKFPMWEVQGFMKTQRHGFQRDQGGLPRGSDS